MKIMGDEEKKQGLLPDDEEMDEQEEESKPRPVPTKFGHQEQAGGGLMIAAMGVLQDLVKKKPDTLPGVIGFMMQQLVGPSQGPAPMPPPGPPPMGPPGMPPGMPPMGGPGMPPGM